MLDSIIDTVVVRRASGLYGAFVVTLPDDLIRLKQLQSGDKATFKLQDGGTIVVEFSKSLMPKPTNFFTRPLKPMGKRA